MIDPKCQSETQGTNCLLRVDQSKFFNYWYYIEAKMLKLLGTREIEAVFSRHVK